LFLNPERREADLHKQRSMREYKTLIIKGSVGKCKLGFWRVVGYFES
jgi:hypothetical protein